jgi:peptide/nickel transport system permease protein
MLSYLFRRIGLALPTLLIVAIVVFSLVRLIPGDPVIVMLGDNADATQVAALRSDLGLDRPFVVQFAVWMGHLAHGDFGRSIATGQPVLPLMLERFQVSAVVVVLAVTVATLIAVCAGLLAAWRQNSAADLAVVAGATIVLSVPSFWLGLMFLVIFGLKLGWLPVVGYVSFADDFGAAARYVILPVATLGIIEAGVLTRMARASAIEVLRLEYVTHARAKGLSEWRVLWRHVLPNSFAPVLTMVGLITAHLLGGIAVLETVFTLPGLGRLLVDSILARDYPVIQGCLLLTASVYVVINLLVDLCYPLLDPRVLAR